VTITRRRDGTWELRTREGTLLGTGDLYWMVTLWTRIRRDGWSTVPFGEPAHVNGRTTTECTAIHDCRCRRCNHPPDGL
jgi:hypothetical protein